jgi:hypothetical protein
MRFISCLAIFTLSLLFPCVAFYTQPATAHTIALSMSQYSPSECQMGNDSGPGLRTVYVHHITAGSFGSRFMVSADPGANLAFVSEDHPFAMTVGNTQDGITICYGTCTPYPVVVAITYMSLGPTQNCSRISVVPHPGAEVIGSINCYGDPEPVSSDGIYVVAPGDACGCPSSQTFLGTPTVFGCSPVPVETSTWGHVKALYR